MNRVLARQLLRLGLSPDEVPTDPRVWGALLERIDTSYDDADRARRVLERSLEVSSREMQDFNENVRDLARREVERTQQISQHNFNELPVAAWLEDFRGAVARIEDLRASGVEDLTGYLATHAEALRDLVGRVEVLDCNPAVSELVGVDREELLGTVDASSLGADSLGSWQRQFEAIWDGSGRVEVEFTGQRFSGSPFSAILHWSVAQIDGVFDFSRVMVVVIDITDRKAAEEKMRQLVLAKDEFLASVSHELRTPLTSVLGYAEVLMDDGIEPDERHSMLSTIAAQAADLSDLVEDLLVGARADVGQLEVDSAPIEIGAVIDGCLVAFPGIERVGRSDGQLVALADGGRVRQILRNLLTNAERYGGPRIAIHSVAAGPETVEISVRDSGPPVEAGLTGEVFDRYFREHVDQSRTGAVGIGLTISRDLARLMGGDLTYRHDGEWSEFVLTLLRVGRRLRAVG